jgi:ribonuclease P protein subunit RPR2
MIRVASERVTDLFGLAETDARRGPSGYADRYVALARKVGMRYNVRLLPEYRELYCRGCSTYWVEGRTVRTRLRSGRRVRTCLVCGRSRRVPLRRPAAPRSLDLGSPGSAARSDVSFAEVPAGVGEDGDSDAEEDE